MKRLALCLILLLTFPVRADSIDDAEAKRRGVAVEQIQLERDLKAAKARIAQLEKEVTELRQGIVPAPTPEGMFSLVAELKGMPDNLRPRDGESDRTAESRLVWLKDHLQNKHIRVTFKVSIVRKVKEKIEVHTSDTPADFYPICEFSADAGGKIATNDMLDVEGDIIGVDISGGAFGNARGSVTLTNCKIVSQSKAK